MPAFETELYPSGATPPSVTISDLGRIEAGDAVTLSTGETIELPATLEATMAAVLLPADRERVAAQLPPNLSPIRAGCGKAPVWLLSVAYNDVGGGAIEPYDEFAVVLGATPGPASGVPYLSPLVRTEGYVWYMPVTHESARAFGDEIWAFPKVVGDVDVREADGWRETTVAVDGERVVSLAMKRPPTISRTDSITAYTATEAGTFGVAFEFSGRMGAWPYSGQFSCTLGDHPKADELRTFGLGDRAYLRFFATGEFTIYPGRRVADRS